MNADDGALQVRVADPHDADAIGVVHVRAWQAAYRGVMSDEYLADLDPQERAEVWRTILTGPPRPGVRLVLLAGERVVGFAACGPALEDSRADGERRLAAEPPETVPGQVYAINLDPDVWGRGGGALLLDACEDALATAGHVEARLWVATLNDRARRFYERRGWAADGASMTDDVMGAVVDEVRYRKRL